MIFRPTLWATIASAAALAVLIGLGSWQLDRRVWKQQLLDVRAERIAGPAVNFTPAGVTPPATLDEIEYRPIDVRGRYRAGDDVKLLSRTRGGRPGFRVITPLVAEATGATVLVDRGWAPVEGGADIAPAPSGLVTVEGYVRRFETPGRFTPDNAPADGAWFYLDQAQLATALNLTAVAPFYVQRAPGGGPPGTYPVGSVPDIALRNPHLQYALTWYALAGALLVIYVMFHMRRRTGEDDDEGVET